APKQRLVPDPTPLLGQRNQRHGPSPRLGDRAEVVPAGLEATLQPQAALWRLEVLSRPGLHTLARRAEGRLHALERHLAAGHSLPRPLRDDEHQLPMARDRLDAVAVA